MEMSYPVEYLNRINLSRMPLYKLQSKVGAPVVILWNLELTKRLCNGTQAILTCVSPHVLEVKIVVGEHAGNTVFIPLMTISSSAIDLPFILIKHRQFPIHPTLLMTINKS